MATWRQALEVVMTDEDVARLTALSRSRTEPASRVQRAQMLRSLVACASWILLLAKNSTAPDLSLR